MIYSVLLILFAILPTIIISTYVYKKDENKEPPIILLILFLIGIVAGPTILGISNLLEEVIPFLTKSYYNLTMPELIFKTFISVALLEEFIKWLIVVIIGYKNKEFDETYDIIVYSIFASLGFATFENLFYVLVSGSLQVAVQRAIVSVPAHVSFATFMSYYLCLAKINKLRANKKDNLINLIKSIIVPTLFHGIFDLCLFANKSIYVILFYVYIVVLFLLALERLKEVYKENVSLIKVGGQD